MTQPSKENLEQALALQNWEFNTREIEHGIQYELAAGVRINLYNTGRIVFGGPASDFKSEVESFVRNNVPTSTSPTRAQPSTRHTPTAPQGTVTVEPRVFVVYGHDTDARDKLELLLRRVHVNPIILQNIPAVGETLIEKLESLTNADFACVLVTPDDVGTSKETPDDLKPRARQNVILEMGMVLSRLGRARVAILVKGTDIERPSDIDGLIYIPFNEDVNEVANALGAALASSGFNIDVRDLLGS